MDQSPADQDVLTVSQLTMQIKDLLEGEFPRVWVSGELTDLARPKSGHIYLTLKDDQAQLRGVIWRGTATRMKFSPEDGQQVLCCGDIDVYPPRGSYQLVIREVQPIGEGAMQLALRQLQQRLTAEGLFNPEHKQPLPAMPSRIAFVTSPTGAAVRDFLEVLRRRWPSVHVMVIPARVQGSGAADEIAAGIELANRLKPAPDLLVVGRGGGSLEDLWCFNEERVVRAIFASQLPVVSAVGHEIDVTLADLVADRRALTPSEAAEIVVPSREQVLENLSILRRRALTAQRTRLQQLGQRIEQLRSRRVLRRPDEPLRMLARRIDELEFRFEKALDRHLNYQRDTLAAAAARLNSLSPLGVLARGYSMTHRSDETQLITSADQVAEGELIVSRLASGELVSRVEQVRPGDDQDQPFQQTEEGNEP